MCRIGRGKIDYASIRDLLREQGYGGFITIERERGPRNSGSILDDRAASRSLVREIEF